MKNDINITTMKNFNKMTTASDEQIFKILLVAKLYDALQTDENYMTLGAQLHEKTILELEHMYAQVLLNKNKA